MSCVTKVELDMPVVTAHSSYMYWETLQRREAWREGRELRRESGERQEAAEARWRTVVVCKEREVEDSSALWLWQHGEHSHAHLR